MPDYMFQLESRLSPEQRAAMVRIQELAAEFEANLYLVGGAVRDVVSGMPIRDLDFTIEGNPARIVRELEKGGAKVTKEDESLRAAELVLSGRCGCEHFGRARGYLRAPRSETGNPLFHDYGRFAAPRFLHQRHCDFPESEFAGLASRSHQRPRRPRAARDSRPVDSQFYKPARASAARTALCGPHGVQDGVAHQRTGSTWRSSANCKTRSRQEDAGSEFRQVAREEKPAAVLKSWESHDLLEVVHPQLAKRHPDYDAINRIFRVREDMVASGLRPRLFAPVTVAILGRLKDSERKAVLSRMSLRSSELRSVQDVEPEALKIVKLLTGPKTATARDAYAFLEKAPLDLLAYILAESNNGKAVGKIQNLLQQVEAAFARRYRVSPRSWKLLGMERGPKFDKVVEDFFQVQLLGRARKPEDHAKILRKLAGIKEPPKKVEEKKKPEKPKKKGEAGLQSRKQLRQQGR